LSSNSPGDAAAAAEDGVEAGELEMVGAGEPTAEAKSAELALTLRGSRISSALEDESEAENSGMHGTYELAVLSVDGGGAARGSWYAHRVRRDSRGAAIHPSAHHSPIRLQEPTRLWRASQRLAIR
jgi:hypothetical protein